MLDFRDYFVILKKGGKVNIKKGIYRDLNVLMGGSFFFIYGKFKYYR